MSKMSKTKYQVGDKVFVSLYQTDGIIVGVFNEKKKLYKVQVANHVLIIGEDRLTPP
jgi:hypothetical protein